MENSPEYTKGILDFIEINSYDNFWDISTKPHHVHQRGKKTATESKMQENLKVTWHY